MGQRIAKTVTNKNTTDGTDKYVTTYYVRDPQGNVLAVYEHKHGDSDNGTFTLTEQHLYGASRLGMRKRNLALNVSAENESTPPVTLYELTNHLGNVLAVITDEDNGASNEPNVESLMDYYPFGMEMLGRKYVKTNGERYRYGFQGQDKEKELWGGEASFFKYRISDNRLGRFFSVDPLSSKFPWNSCYAFSENRVIDGIELEGLEVFLTGSEASKGFKQLQNSVKDELVLTKDDNGKLSAKQLEGVKELSSNADHLLRAINSTEVETNVICGNSFFHEGSFVIGGAFRGNVKGENGKVKATQYVDVSQTKVLDKIAGSSGGFILHEVTEAFEGGLITYNDGNSKGVGPALDSDKESDAYKLYLSAHAKAVPQPKELDVKYSVSDIQWNVDMTFGTVESHRDVGFFTNGKQFIWATDKDFKSFEPESTTLEGFQKDSNAKLEAKPEDE